MITIKELSYSFHLSNDKNKTKKARQIARNSKTNTTSFNNNAIQNYQQLSKVDKHNLRKYDEEKNLINTIYGTSSLVNDVKDLYKTTFDKSKADYNNKQTRNDRKIDNYFEHISNDNKHDLACEIIVELGNMDFWSDKNDSYKNKMVDVYKEQVDYLQEIVPDFKIANATIHFDEFSPHLHIVGVPIKDGNKNGMSIQVGKCSIFTKESLTNMQDKMRLKCITSFNEIYKTNYILKDKEKGRNNDILVSNMDNYKELKTKQKENEKLLNVIDNKVKNLSNNSNDISSILENLKVNKINKNNYTISNEEISKIKDYINKSKDVSKDIKDSNKLIVTMNKLEKDLLYHDNEIKELNRRVSVRDEFIDDLRYKLGKAYNEIDELEEQVSKLEEIVDYFKDLWEKFIKFLNDKFFDSNDYDEIINELQDEDILNQKDIDYIYSKEKDDFEL